MRGSRHCLEPRNIREGHLALVDVHAPEFGYSDYEGIGVAGKIIAALGNAPASLPNTQRAYYSSGRTKAQEAVSRGAVGFIGLRSRRTDEFVPWDRVKAQAGTRPGMAWITLTGEPADCRSGNAPRMAGAVPRWMPTGDI